MQVSSDQNQKTKKGLAINRSILNTLLLVILVVGLSASISGFVGYQLGKREGARLAVKKVTDFLNPLNAVSDNPLFPTTTIGKVSAISKTSVTVKQPNGSEKTIPLDSKTRVTQQDKNKSIDDVKKNTEVTVFANGKGDDTVANRIVIR
jgi:hypothetical protein